MPLIYFLLHGILTLVDLKGIWLWIALLVPLPLLFHQPFLQTFIQPYFEFANSFLTSIPIRDAMYSAITASGIGHFLILTASFQVPQKLGWKTEFARLGKFNQKIFWTYDFVYFKHDDWPKGDIFIVGHTCLTALFSSLALVHWAVVAWHLYGTA